MSKDLIEVQEEFKNSKSIPYSKEISISQLMKEWQTPGLYLQQKINNNPLVRLIGEIYYQEYLQVVIVIDDDPEKLLDKIFTIEREMYNNFKEINFDLRVRVINKEEQIEDIKQSLIIRYERKEVE